MGSLVGAEDGVKDAVSKLSTGQDEAVKWSQKLARYGLGAKVDSYLVCISTPAEFSGHFAADGDGGIEIWDTCDVGVQDGVSTFLLE